MRARRWLRQQRHWHIYRRGSLAERWPILSASASLTRATGTDIIKKSGATVLADEITYQCVRAVDLANCRLRGKMSIFIFALLIGIIAGLRTMTAPAAIAWAAYLGWLPVAGTFAGFMSHWIAVAVFTIAALAELVTDQLPSTPSRKVPQQFGARVVSGAFSGAVIGTVGGALLAGLIAGVVGAVIGTYGGAEARARLAGTFGKDLPAALIEDAVAILGALWIVSAVV
jgi:uncharacterized membrane protein